MAYNLSLTGQLSITPDPSQTDADLSGDPGLAVLLSLLFTLSAKETQTIALTINDAVPVQVEVSLAGIESADFLMLRTTVPAVIGIGTDEGPGEETVYVSKMLILDTRDVPVTSLTLEAQGTTAGVAYLTMGRV